MNTRTEDPRDYTVMLRSFDHRFGERMRACKIRPTAIRGTNFMTPDRIGYVDVDGVAVELSWGTGFDHEFIYGVTFDPIGTVTDERSCCCHSLDEVAEVIGE